MTKEIDKAICTVGLISVDGDGGSLKKGIGKKWQTGEGKKHA